MGVGVNGLRFVDRLDSGRGSGCGLVVAHADKANGTRVVNSRLCGCY